MECIERARQVMREGSHPSFIRFPRLCVHALLHEWAGKLNCALLSGKLPWAAVSVWGFEDAPLSWGKHEHGFLQGGENDYTFIMFPDESYWLFLAPGTHDTFS